MSRTTNNYLIDKDGNRKHIDFIKTLVEIGEPFNSSLINGYSDYLAGVKSNEYGDKEKDTKECFFSILNKIGEDGCQILTDRIVNYIDDVSNIDTTTPSALLSQAKSLGYPYKDKKIVEQLSRLSQCSPYLQNLIWAVSTNATNSKTILNRLHLADSEISSIFDTETLNSKISDSYFDDISSNVFGKRYLYLDREDEESQDFVSDVDSPALIDFSWVLYSIFANEIVKNEKLLDKFFTSVIDFGKYNRTIYSIVCYTYLYSQIYKQTHSEESLKTKELNDLAHKFMPFLYDNKLFDPIQAAWSIIYDTTTISDFDTVYHETINDFIKAFNEKLNDISYNAVINWLASKPTYKENLSFVYRLNANSFAYQQQILQIISDVKSLFGIDICKYFVGDYDTYLLDSLNYGNSTKIFDGFYYLCTTPTNSLLTKIKFDEYISDIISEIFAFGKKIRTLREDLRLMTLRNSYKGTTALIQFSVIEYLKDCLGDLVYQAQEKYNFDYDKKLTIPAETFKNILTTIEGGEIPNKNQDEKPLYFNPKTQNNIAVSEYWDYTEYFNRYYIDDESAKIANTNSGSRVDWNDPATDDPTQWRVYGTMKEDEIFDFYTKVLKLDKDLYLNKTDYGLGYIKTDYSEQLVKLKQFLQAVYNSGVFTYRTNNNFESVYSGNASETSNDTPWVAYKNKEFISKEIHPYIWNFTKKIASKLYRANVISVTIQNAEYELLSKHIDEDGNIIDQYRLSKNFVDSSGYVTRYEHRDHFENEKTQSYDGIIYPQFGYEISKLRTYDNLKSQWKSDPISASFKERWYNNQLISLTENQELKELECLKQLFKNDALLKSIYFNPSYTPQTELSGVLGDYCIDMFETAYGTDPYNHHQFLYKENGYPFMRPLINGEYGMLFIDSNDNIDDDFMNGLSINNNIDDNFPRIVISKDGSHILIRTDTTIFRSYTVGAHKNANNETEKALILNCEIKCDPVIFEDRFFNDALIKTIDDDFYILVPKYKENEFTNYLFYIKKNRRICALKQTIKNVSDEFTQLFRSGLFFIKNGQKININTFFLDKSQELPDSAEVSAIYTTESEKTKGNHQTPYKNWEISSSSFDVLNQFVQQYTSKEFVCDDMTDISLSFENPDIPSVDLTIDAIDSNTKIKEITEVSVVNNFLYGTNNNIPLLRQTTTPFIRMYNINSDAGFNPIYIGDRGRIILEKRRGSSNPTNDDPPSQFKYVVSTGAAFELLGPEVNFDTTEIIDSSSTDNIYDEILNDNDRMFERIHECYSKSKGEKSFTDEQATHAISFDTTDEDDVSYKYGYTSILEHDAYKNDTYRILKVMRATFVNKDYTNGCVVTNGLQSITIPNQSSPYQNHRIYIFLGVNNNLFSIIPRVPNTILQTYDTNATKKTEFTKIAQAINNGNAYSINFENTFVFNKIEFNSNSAKLYGKNVDELINAQIYLVHVASKDDVIETPNFMLPTEELRKALTNISSDMIDEHIRIPHHSATEDYMNIKSVCKMNDWEVTEVNSDPSATTGSLVFSITETDSEFMNKLLPDQRGKHDIKSVTTEAMNSYCRYQYLAGTKNIDGTTIAKQTFDVLDYNFEPWNIIDLNLKREENTDVSTGIDDIHNAVDKQYIIQPYEKINIHQDASNKYIISFWRKSEESTNTQNLGVQIENVLPNKVKTTEYLEPIYANDHQALGELLADNDFVPQLMVQWEYENDNTSAIDLRFNNAAIGDALFINTNSGLEFKSLSTFSESITLKPGESGYIDVVAPNHIQVGSTVFYHIPLMRALATNISDNKPKFMLTLMNDKSNDHFSLESNNYALVFISSSEPQVSNSDIVYVTCYVAPMLSSNQTIPPSINNAVTLSELAFNFDVGNIINYKKSYDEETGEPIETADNVLIEKINVITPKNKMSSTASTCIGYADSSHQIRVNEPIGKETEGFVTVDIKINLQDLSKLSLKNALFTAHGTVIAYDNTQNPKALPIVKVFGCSLDRIGVKRVLGLTEAPGQVLTVTQNSGRETALQVNPETFEQKDDEDDSNE